MFKKIITIMLLIVTFNSFAEESPNLNPDELTQKVLQSTFDTIKDRQEEIKENTDLLIDIINEEVKPHLNSKFAAFYVLGSNFRKLSKEELNEFVDAFEEYYLYNVASMFSFYKGQEVKFHPYKEISPKTSTVDISIFNSGSDNITLTVKLKKSNKKGRWLAYDLTAEGISLLTSKRNEFSPIIRKDGIAKVIEIMKNKSQNKIKEKDLKV